MVKDLLKLTSWLNRKLIVQLIHTHTHYIFYYYYYILYMPAWIPTLDAFTKATTKTRKKNINET